MTDQTSATVRLSGEVREAWTGGGIVDIEVEALRPVDRWTIDVDLGGKIINIWNARILSRDGDTYRLGPLDYNTQIAEGGATKLGVQVQGDPQFVPLGADAAEAVATTTVLAANAAPLADTPAPPAAAADTAQTVAQAGQPGQGAPAATPPTPPAPDSQPEPIPTGEAIGSDALRLTPQSLRYYDAPGTGPVGLFVKDETVEEPSGTLDGLPHDSFAPGPFSTSGTTIVDSAGNPAEINGINWFGLETDLFTPHGLWARNWREIMDEVKSLGFNTIRLPFSGDLVASDGGKPNGIDFALNPDLEGLSGLEILDAIVDYADRIGLRILLDYHRGVPGGGPNDNGLWYGEGRTEADVIDEWRTMAERYKDAPAVIGADLMNEPHAATWGDGSATDWAAAAERIGDAVLEVAPDWLIVVEGISTYEGDTYWWGGNLQGVRERPVTLSRSDRLVYSPHDYPASVHAQDWFFDGTDLASKFRQNWGYIVEDGLAPVLLGEWGSRLETPIDKAWALDLARYLREHDIQWFWWSLNPNSGDTGGLLQDDWTTVRTDVTSLLEPFLSDTRPAISIADEAVDTGASAAFTIRLEAPAAEDIIVKYATTDGTAHAGDDYVSTAGQLLFAQGEQAKTVRVPILPDGEAEGDEFFYLVLGGSGVTEASATARIEENGEATAAGPYVDVASAVVGEDATTARFRVMLSEAAQRDVTIGFTAVRDAAPNEPTRGTFIIPQGAREATVEVTIDHDRDHDDTGPTRYTLDLTSADGAQLRTAEAVALVASQPPAAAEITVGGEGGAGAAGGPEGAAPRLTLDIVMEDDWGSGSLFNVEIRNVSSEPVSAWQLGLDLPFDLVELWSAVMVSDAGERVTLRNADWNGTIEPGESVDFGFIADEGGMPVQAIVDGAALELLVE